MARGKEKVRTGFYIEKELLELADNSSTHFAWSFRNALSSIRLSEW